MPAMFSRGKDCAMPGIERKPSVSADTMRKEINDLMDLARTAGMDAGFTGLPADFETRLEPLLSLSRQRVFGDGIDTGERRRQKILELEAEHAMWRGRVENYRT